MGIRGPSAITGHAKALFAPTFTPDGKLLTASDDGTARLWDVSVANRPNPLIDFGLLSGMSDFRGEPLAGGGPGWARLPCGALNRGGRAV
jgi:WD40 repeat protein